MASPLRGKLEVTMHVYSGKPDPTWEIDEDSIDADLQFDALRSYATYPSQRLGYRGFSVKRKQTDIPPPRPVIVEGAMLTHPAMPTGVTDEGLSEPTSSLSIIDNPHLEKKLLETSSVIDESLKNYVCSCLEGPTITRAAPVVVEAAEFDAAIQRQFERFKDVTHTPPYEPSKWNNECLPSRNLVAVVKEPWHDILSARDHQSTNNCYNYGNNIITDTFAQPGKAAGKPYQSLTGEEVQRAAEADGLKADEEDGWNRVALVIWPNMDYHWYRLDNSGLWSHKPGRTPVVDTDNSDKKIFDPETCDRGPYTEFVGYMWTHPDHVKIE